MANRRGAKKQPDSGGSFGRTTTEPSAPLRERLERFATDWNAAIGRVRRERAWALMLAVRKAYTLCFRRGAAGKWRFVRWMLTGFRERSDLLHYEPFFPVIDDYIPDAPVSCRPDPTVDTSECVSPLFDEQTDGNTAAFPSISIIVVTFNSQVFLPGFFKSLLECTGYPNCEFLFVDNASSDGTRGSLEQFASGNLHTQLTALAENAGFAAANNIAARQARGDYLVFLNPDVVLTAGWLTKLIEHCQRDSAVGLVAPVTNFSANESRVESTYLNRCELEQFAHAVAERNCGRVRELECAPFFCVLMPRRVWTAVGDLDERFGIGMFEDDDYCRRIRLAGYRVITAEDCFVHHFGQGSFRKLSESAYASRFENNRRLFEKKWGKQWRGHRTRAGVRPLDPGVHHDVNEFWAGGVMLAEAGLRQAGECGGNG